MNMFEDVLNLNSADFVRRYDEFWKSELSYPEMYYNCSVALNDKIHSEYSISKTSTSVHFFSEYERNENAVLETSHVGIITYDRDEYPELEITLFKFRLDDDAFDLIDEFNSFDDITEEVLKKYSISKEQLLKLYSLSTEFIEILKKDETIQKVVL